MKKSVYRKIKNMKYRHKLTIILVVASLVPMLVLALDSYIRMSDQARHNEMEDMKSILEQTQNTIDNQVDVYANLLNYLTYSPDLEELLTDNDRDAYGLYELYTQVADPLLSVPKSYHNAILQIQLYAESIPVKHDYTLIPLKDSEQEWWYEKMQDTVNVQWMMNPEKGEAAAVRRIYSRQTETARLCIILDYEKLFQPFESIAFEAVDGLIADKNGEIIYHSNKLGMDVKNGEIMEEVLPSIEKKCVCVSSASDGNGWVYYLYRPKADITRSVSEVLVSEIPLVLLCLVIILLLGPVVSRKLTRSIELLTENMNRVNEGIREVTVESDSEDEIGILIRSFQNMMDEINRLIHEVYETRIALKEFELKALQAQINPHFLYNSLSAINWMAIRSKQSEISRVTLALSTFYRTALSRGEDMVTIETCIRNIEAYLEIQLIMHDNDFQIEWEKDPGIFAEKVPKLILQPVVENALEHGLDLVEEGEKILKISFLDAGKDVLIVVEDNGEGMEPEKAQSLVTYHTKGYGLKNVNDRICLLYGEEYGIRIISAPGQGKRVEIRTPKGGSTIEKIQKII